MSTPALTCESACPTETLIDVNDLSSAVRLLQPQAGKEGVMVVGNEARDAAQNWQVGRIAPGPSDSSFVITILYGAQRAIRSKGGVSWSEESLFYTLKSFVSPLWNSETLLREITAIKINVQGNTPPLEHYF